MICALHKDRPHHLHIHFCFWEKEPKVKNKRAAGYKYRAKGKIPMPVIDHMVERLNAYELDGDLKRLRQDVFTSDWHRKMYRALCERGRAHDMMQDLIHELPPENLGYAHKGMEPYRIKIDALVEEIIKKDWELSDAIKDFAGRWTIRKRFSKTLWVTIIRHVRNKMRYTWIILLTQRI